jgi:hypothetical protein
MSLNSLQDDMSRRAASMAAMAKRANRPEEIQAIQKSLIAGVQSGSIQPYVGIPLIQELTNKLSEVKTKMAQTIAGAGMPQPPQPGAPIAQQVMQQAAQADQSQGLEALPSNLPQQYAGGGIIAFEDGGQVERYQSKGYTGNPMGMGGSEIMSAAGTADPYVGKGLLGTLLFAPDDPEWKRKLKVEQALRERDEAMGIKPSVAPLSTNPIVPYGQSQATNLFGGAGGAGDAGGSGVGGGGGFKMPTLPTMKDITVPTLTDYNTLIGNLPKKTKEASEAAVKASQAELESFDKPGFESREGRLGQREASLERDSAISRALTGIKTGLRIAGSKERTIAGALGNEGAQGIEDLIRGEAANRAAKDRLEDARDNLEQQKIAAKKGNYQAAQAAGKDAANDLRAGMQLTMTGAHYGNTEALNRYQTQQQGEYQKTSLAQSGALGLSGLDLQNRQLLQTGAFQNKQLAAMEQRYAALDKQAQARMAQVRANAFGKFMETQGGQLNAQLAKEYGPNWRTSTDPRSLEAQMKFKQAQNAYIIDALGQYDSALSAKDSSDL